MALSEQQALLVYEYLNRAFPEDLHLSRPLVGMLIQAGKRREASECAFLTAQRMVSSHLPSSALGFLEICRQLGHPGEDEINSLRVIAELTAQNQQKVANNRLFPLISQLSDQESFEFICHGELLHIEQGQDVLIQDEVSDSFYLILDGNIHIHMQNDAKVFSLNCLSAGDFFGEFASIYHLPRSATATAVSSCLLLELSEEDIQQLMQTSPLAGEYLLKVVQQRMVHSMSRSHPALANIADADREWLAEQSNVVEFSAGHVLQVDELLAHQWMVLFMGSLDGKNISSGRSILNSGDVFSRAVLTEHPDSEWRVRERSFFYCIPEDVFYSFRNAYVEFDDWVSTHVPEAPVTELLG